MKFRLPGPENHFSAQNQFSPARMRFTKRVIIPIVCILVCLMVCVIVLRTMFPSERLRQLAIAKLEETTGLSISVRGATISLVHWRIGVKITGVEISAPTGGNPFTPADSATAVDSAGPDEAAPGGQAAVNAAGTGGSPGRAPELVRLASIPRLGIAVSILPLLKREIVVDELYVDDADVSLKLGGGPILRSAPKAPRAASGQMPMSFSLSKAVINDASIEITDVRTGSTIVLKHLDASSTVSADRRTEILSLEGKSSVREISVTSAKKSPLTLPAVSAKLAWKARFALREKLLELESASATIAEFPLDVAGKVDLGGEKPMLDLRISAEKIAPEKLLAFAPKSIQERTKGAKIAGQIDVAGTVRGKMPSPDVDVQRFSASFGGSSVSGRGRFNTVEPRSLSFETKGNLKLDELAAVLPAGKGPRVTSGVVSFHITGEGLVDELKANPLSLQASGEAAINSVRIELPPPSPAVLLDKATLILSGRSVEISNAAARIGNSIFNATGRVRDWKERSLDLELSSPSLDLGELVLPIAKQQKSAGKQARTIAMPMKALPAKGIAKLHVDKLKFGNFGASNLDAQVAFGGDSVVVKNVAMNTLGGKCSGASRLTISEQGGGAYGATFSAGDIQLNELLSTLTPVRDFMSGISFLDISVEGKLSETTPPLKSVAAKGQVRTTQAEAIASPLVATIASWVGLEKKDQYAFRDFATTFLVQDGRVILPQCRLEEKNTIWDFTGSTGFDGTLSYKVNLTFSQEYSKRTGSLRGLAQLIKDEQGRVVVDLIVGGTVKKPTLRWDQTRMEQRAKELLAQKVQNQLGTQTKKAEQLGQELEKKLGSKADTLKAETATKGVKLLEDLLKKRKK